MKLYILPLLAIAAEVASAIDISIECTAEGIDCHNVKQLSEGNERCENDGSVLAEATFTVKYCTPADAISNDEGSTYTLLKGAALWVDGTTPPITRYPQLGQKVNGCFVDTFTLPFDKCENHFNVNAYAALEGGGSYGHEFETFMKRNCDFEVDVSCTLPNGEDCSTMTECDPSGTTEVTYQACISTGYTQQTIDLRKFYIPDTNQELPRNCENDGSCLETHFYIGRNFDKEFFLPQFANNVSKLGLMPDGSVNGVYCFEKRHEVNTCASQKIPRVSANAVGAVTYSQNPVTVPVSDFKACYSRSVYPEVFFLPRGATDSPRVPGTPSASPTISMSPNYVPTGNKKSKGTLAPKSKGTLAPKSKGTLAPKKRNRERKVLRKN